MANIKSAKKRILVSEKRRLSNRYKLVSTRSLMKKLRNTTSKAVADELLPKVTSMLDRLAKHNIIHPNKAARHKSQLALLVQTMK
jgi:small subunit ribosomal protein S20